MEKQVLRALTSAVVLLCLCAVTAHAQTCDEVITNPYTKTWLIALGHDWGGYEYISEAGYLGGFSYDFIRAVCREALINCRTLWESYNRCWDGNVHSHPVGGVGLLGGWYDACTGWVATVDRIHVFDFSMPFLDQNSAHFFIRPGVNFDAFDIRGKTIGFLDGWSSDEKCVARQTGVQGHFLPQGSVKYYQETGQLVDAIKSGEVDAGFQTLVALKAYVDNGDIEVVTTRGFFCAISGNSMMTRKDNDFISHWNRGFQKLRNTGDFKSLCDQAAKDHAKYGEIKCVLT